MSGLLWVNYKAKLWVTYSLILRDPKSAGRKNKRINIRISINTKDSKVELINS